MSDNDIEAALDLFVARVEEALPSLIEHYASKLVMRELRSSKSWVLAKLRIDAHEAENEPL